MHKLCYCAPLNSGKKEFACAGNTLSLGHGGEYNGYIDGAGEWLIFKEGPAVFVDIDGVFMEREFLIVGVKLAVFDDGVESGFFQGGGYELVGVAATWSGEGDDTVILEEVCCVLNNLVLYFGDFRGGGGHWTLKYHFLLGSFAGVGCVANTATSAMMARTTRRTRRNLNCGVDMIVSIAFPYVLNLMDGKRVATAGCMSVV